MATTVLRKTKPRKKLNDRELRFVMEYLVRYDATQAVLDAGYSCKTRSQASVMGCKLMKRPYVARMVGELRRETVEKLELEREAVLRQLYY